MANQKAGTVATLAIVAAIISFIVTFSGSPILGLLTALLAIVLGIVGVVVSASPRIGGGLMSIIAIGLGALDLGIAILGFIGVIIF